jgi:putative drug exporter of the RND superfamily
LAHRSARHPWRTLGAWFILLVIGLMLASGLGDTLTTEMGFTNSPESERGHDLIEERLRPHEAQREFIIVNSETHNVDAPEFRAFVDDLMGQVLAQSEVVAGAVTYYDTNDPAMVSDDGTAMMIPVSLIGTLAEANGNFKPYLKVIESFDGTAGFEVVSGGNVSADYTITHTTEKDLMTGEMIGIPAAIVILMLVFGVMLAAGVPLVLAIVSILISLGVTTVVGQAFELSIFTMNMIFMIGLAVGIDYALFIVGRYREELGKGRSTIDAIARAGDTASKAVLFSGLTVVIALSGLLIVPSSVYKSLAAGAIIVVIVSVLATLTMLPALLRLMGGWINKGRLPFFGRDKGANDTGGFWARVANVVMRRPLVSILMVGAFLISLTGVYFTAELGQSGISSLPQKSGVYRAFSSLENDFSGGSLESPAEIVVDAANVNSPAVRAGIDRLVEILAADTRFDPASVEVNAAGDLAVVSVPVLGDNQSSGALSAIERVRGEYVPAAFNGVDADIMVTGPTAFTLDFNSVVNTYTPIVFALVLGMSFLLLMMAFRSIVVPAKAIVMNLLSVGASYGLLVAVFQHGVGNEIFGFQQVERIEAWIPLLLFSILFGLSMDYHVFLLSRIRERYDVTGDNAGSVAYGVRSTAKIITGAALIMVAVFSGFAMGELVSLQQMGFGLAVAVILDATIVRSVLVPASMKLLGDRNWYLPAWLAWLPNIQVEGAPDPEEEVEHVPSRPRVFTPELVAGD